MACEYIIAFEAIRFGQDEGKCGLIRQAAKPAGSTDAGQKEGTDEPYNRKGLLSLEFAV